MVCVGLSSWAASFKCWIMMLGLQLALSTAAAEMHAAVVACGLQAWILHGGLRCGTPQRVWAAYDKLLLVAIGTSSWAPHDATDSWVVPTC
ncbi:hypothetical protein Dimus_020534 [Dionaea muscipula]